MTRCSIAWLVGLLVAAPAQAQDDLGLWRAMLTMGDGSPGSVIGRTDAARDSLVAFGKELRIDEPSVSMMDRMREAVIELDLGGLHEMLPNQDGPEHSIRFYGEPQTERYDWTLYPAQGAVCDGTLLAVSGQSKLEPVEQDVGKGKGFAVSQELDVGTGPWQHGDVAAAFEGFLAELEVAAKTAPTADQIALVQRHQAKLDSRVDQALAASVIRAVPNASSTLSRLVRVDRVGSMGEHGLDVDFVGRLDLGGMRAMGYPTLAKYIDKLDNLVVFDMSVRDSHGLPLMVVGFYSAGPGLRVAFTTHDGALLARRKGTPDPERAVRPTDDSVDLRLRADVEVRAEGMLLRVSDYEIPIAYRSQGGGADLSMPITSEPEVEFTGQGRVTSWIAELADSALNLETHGRAIFKAVAQGQDGKGSKAVVRYDDRPANGVVSGSMDLMLVDNALVRMGFRIVGRHLTPDDAVVSEAMDLAGRLIQDAERDYASVRETLVAWDG